MAEEKEASFPVEDFSGINRNVAREDMGPMHYYASKNLWEKTLGVLETRGGCTAFAEYPTNISKITGTTKLYKQSDDHKRLAYVQCTPDLTGWTDMKTFADLPSWITASFVSDGAGYWNNNFTISAVSWSGKALAVYIRLVGYGIDHWYSNALTTVSGYANNTDQKFRVTVNDFNLNGNTNYTGYEVYALVNNGTNSNSSTTLMWVGYGRLVGVTDAVKDYHYLPLGQSGSSGTDTQIGETKRTITATGVNDGGGLVVGKTYYVAVLPHHIKTNTTSARRCIYQATAMSRVPGTDIRTLTIPAGDEDTGSIVITGLSANTVTGLVLLGDSPELMRPVGVINEMATSGTFIIRSYEWFEENDAYFTDSPDFFPILPFAPESPAVVDMIPTSDAVADYAFKISTFSINDMLVRIEDDESIWPVFASRMCLDCNVDNGEYEYSTDVGGYYPFKLYYVGEIAIPTLGKGAKPAFESFQELMFFVNGSDPDQGIGQTGDGFPAYRSRNSTNYMMSDGNVAAPVIENFKGRSQACTFTDSGDLVTSSGHGLRNGDPVIFTTINTTTGITVNTKYYCISRTATTFQVATTRGGSAVALTTNGTGVVVVPNRINLPIFKYITSFQGSIALAGGPTTVDRDSLDSALRSSAPLSAARTMYFSNALEYNDFVIAGGSIYQTIAVQDDSEDISGLGIYSNTSTEAGPFTQLVIGKKNKVYVLSDFPSVISGPTLDPSVRVTNLSAKAGLAGHWMIVNTPVGTIIVSVDNVYLLRENGEPTPIGQEISPILKGADLSNGFACYHDRHLKLSFYHEDYDCNDVGPTVNNVEFWLNINKMIEKKGQSDWVGPMTGYSNQYCFVEDADGDGLQYNTARDRFCVDGGEVRTYLADVEPDEYADEVFDFVSYPVESEFITKDYDISPQDNNWNKLLKRGYWKIRSNSQSVDPLEAEEKTWVDGALYETKSRIEWYGNDDDEVGFDDQPLKLNRLFPTGRPRGRTVRKSLKTSQRIGIAGFQLNYEVERRRI